MRGGSAPVPAGVADSGVGVAAGVAAGSGVSSKLRLGVSAGAAGAGVCAREPVAEAGWACAAPAAAVNAAASRIWGKASIRKRMERKDMAFLKSDSAAIVPRADDEI